MFDKVITVTSNTNHLCFHLQGLLGVVVYKTETQQQHKDASRRRFLMTCLLEIKDEHKESRSLIVYFKFCKVYHRWKNQTCKYIQEVKHKYSGGWNQTGNQEPCTVRGLKLMYSSALSPSRSTWRSSAFVVVLVRVSIAQDRHVCRQNSWPKGTRSGNQQVSNSDSQFSVSEFSSRRTRTSDM